jgi:hypothetical protein
MYFRKKIKENNNLSDQSTTLESIINKLCQIIRRRVK